MKQLFLLWALFFVTNSILAQKRNDTIRLRAVTVYGIPLPKYTVGSKFQEVDSLQRANYSTSTLAQLLQEQTPVYIKEYGSGQLATISFRGSGASHTKVLWNGLSINSPTLGQSDFSTLPVFALDKIAIQYGGASALYGSDAFGGTVILGNQQPQFSGKTSVMIQQDFGSYGKLFSGAKLKVSNNKWQSQTSIYRHSAKNDFDYVDLRGEKYKQVNAAIFNYGIVQHLAHKISEEKEIIANVWYANSFNEIQPTMSVLQSHEKISNEALRLSVDYNASGKFGFINIKSGYIANSQVYNDGAPIKTKQVIANINFDKEINLIHFKAGTYLSHTSAVASNYSKPVSENQADIVASVRYEPNTKANLVFNLRSVLMEKEKIKLVPALGGEYSLLTGKEFALKLKSVVSLNFRAPTLNDKYWQPGGNLNLVPEHGTSAEGGVEISVKKEKWQLKGEVTYYNMRISDWILWQPQGNLWSPQNVRKVNASGIEFSLNATHLIGDWHLKWGGNYAYNKSIILSDEANASGKQLPYTPLHRFTIHTSVTYKDWYWQSNLSHTGLRYENTTNTDDVLNAIPSYNLVNSSLSRKISLERSTLVLSLGAQNIFNIKYQNFLFRAMPGRNYEIKIKYQFK